ncbi:protein adenylyltransferase SelO [Gracilibacillus dipsosauri]|uniref:Protein nucleotidyltransferase YdiU n=1 Tax=Gracilibacillus dipsosauri TaxID=178340 RepID=A0A317KU72_9BACI|nr:YdiU family protein [Gracilibacillus dipsosauri]PWU66935.1 YdiU family protein [Gracilibacillus dipsosauri]
MGSTEAGWKFDNSYEDLPEFFYSKVEPTHVKDPEIRVLNHALLQSLGLAAISKTEMLGVFSGNKMPEGTQSISQAYAGHQFGNFTMLGDGRAVLIGEQLTPAGDKFDLQLKGAGKTPYSRGGDGRATLGPMLREYIISEAMYQLGIPTSRSLAVVTTGEEVRREVELPGAILTRVASSHLRFGTFQYAAAFGEEDDIKQLADYAIKRHYPTLKSKPNPYLSLIKEVVNRQGKLIVKWQLVGFIHGVMNTDNMTISGETIDYGPCAFMDEYDPATVFSSIDIQGRYAYGNQPNIGGWNLARFAESLLPILHDEEERALELAQGAIEEFSDIFYAEWIKGMRRKLGLFNEEQEDEKLIEELLQLMQQYNADYTNTFRALTFHQTNSQVLFERDEFKKWQTKWKQRRERQAESEEEVLDLMKKSNPAVIPRNHLVEEAIEAAVTKEDDSVMKNLLDILADPYAHTKEQVEYAALPPKSKRPQQTFCGT